MIVAFTSLSPAGATFMDWSWHWLKGSIKTWNQERGWIPIIEDPIRNRDAHHYDKNHPLGIDAWDEFIESAKKKSDKADISFYPSFLNTDNNLNEFVRQMNRMIEQGVRVVVIKKTQEFPYHTARSNSSDREVDFVIQVNPDLAGQSVARIREIFSFRMVAQQRKWLEKIDSSFRNLDSRVVVVTDKDWAHSTEQTMIEICDRLGTAVDTDRLTKWRPVMERWSHNYTKTKNFYENDIPMMADKIVSGENMDLEPYGLRLVEECLVMMYVMKRHGRRLLLPGDDFPKNTQDLHQFLN